MLDMTGVRFSPGMRERGIALVLVMTVVLALVIIATPFVLSMLMQERSGTIARHESQAGYGADGARNYALWRLMYGNDHQERRFPNAQFSSYSFDSMQEIDVRLDDAFLSNQEAAKVLNPREAIWGLAVQDEQGKLNVRTAPQSAVARLEQLVDGRVANRKDYLTLYSGRDAGWIFPMRIRSISGIGNFLSGPPPNGIGVDNAFHYGPGSRVRVSKPGLKPLIVTVASNGLIAGFGHAIETSPPVNSSYIDGQVEVEARHPVNPNTARIETLVAVFEGLHLWNVPNSQVDRSAAHRLAQAYAGKQTTRLEDFLLTLATLNDLNFQQRAAVAMNAVSPGAVLLDGSGTVGLSFHSYDTYTIEAFASRNNPAASQVAARGFREVVSVSPPAVLMKFVESQWDFDRMLYPAAQLQDWRYVGYPYGSRFTSFPNMIPLPPMTATPSQPPAPSDITLKPQQQKGPNGNEACIRPVSAPDYRGEGQYDNQLAGWQNNLPREHFNDTHEGKKLNGSAHTITDWQKVFTTMPSPVGGPGQQRPDVSTGGVEFWFRLDGAAPSPLPLVDIREQDYSNRITVRVEGPDIIFTLCDGTLGIPGDPTDNGAAEIRQPIGLLSDGTWHHVGAYWRGTRWGQAALLVDGFAHPQQKFKHLNPEGTEILTELTTAMTPTTSSIALKQDGWITGPVALLVGREVMLYDKSAGTLVRGARGTVAEDHPQNAKVTIFGYSSKIRNGQVTGKFGSFNVQMNYDRLSLGGATLKYGFGLLPLALVAGDKMDTTTMQRYVDDTQTDIAVTAPSITADFPDQGYITIDGEVIFYTGRSVGGVGGFGTAKFTGCQRGLHGTTAVRHNDMRQARMWGIPVTNHTDYLDQTILQVDNEWFGPVRKDPTRPDFWISFVDNGNPVRLRRGLVVFGSIPQAHSAGAQVIPTFLIRESDPQVNRENTGNPDAVTIMDAQNQKELGKIRRTNPPRPQTGPPPWDNEFNLPQYWQIVALDAQVSRAYVADDLHVRLLKFPSGELLGLNWLQSGNTPPTFTIGPAQMTIDELKFFAGPKRDLTMGQQASITDTTITLNTGGGLSTAGGLIKVGDEYIGYGSAGAGVLSQVKRAFLNGGPTPGTGYVHDLGDPVFYLQWIPVSTLQADITAQDRVLQLKQALSGRPNLYRRGYVLINQEVIGFEWNGGNGTALSMPARLDGSTGLYRGRFGTSAQGHAADTSLVYGMPWRYWDTWQAREFDNTMVYYQWSTRMDQANWRTMQWDHEVPANDKNVAVHAIVRLDGKGEFWDPPQVGEETLMYEFLLPGAKNSINRVGYQNEAGQFDLRFMVEYKQGSFDPLAPEQTPGWKRAPRITHIQVEYDRPNLTHYHEDR